MADKKYAIFNFPIDYIPQFINEPRGTLRGRVIDFALIYALHYDEATPEDVEWMAGKFGVTLGDKDSCCQFGRKLMAIYRAEPQPLTYIHHDSLWSFVERHTDETDVMAVALLLALRSIGKRGMANKTNISMIAARMSGKARPSKAVHKDVKRWTTRRKLEKLKEYLQERGLAYFPKGRSRGIVFWLSPPPDKETPGEGDGIV